LSEAAKMTKMNGFGRIDFYDVIDERLGLPAKSFK
jgi:hypothetical protein